MNRLMRLGLTALVVSMTGGAAIQAHDEPPKTVQERIEQERARIKTGTFGIERQHVWVIKPGKSGKAADSSLWYTNRYDRAGNLQEQVVYDTSGNTRNISLYDEHGLWLEELSYVGDSLDDRTVFVYDRDGLISIIMDYDDSGRITGQLDYEYSADNQTITVTKSGTPDSIQYSILYTYERGSAFKRQIEVVQTNADGTLRTRAQNLFAEDRRVKKQVYGSDGRLTHLFSYTYTPHGDFSEIVKRLVNDSVAFRQSYRYTPDGLLNIINEQDESGVMTRTFRYVYDFFEKAR